MWKTFYMDDTWLDLLHVKTGHKIFVVFIPKKKRLAGMTLWWTTHDVFIHIISFTKTDKNSVFGPSYDPGQALFWCEKDGFFPSSRTLCNQFLFRPEPSLLKMSFLYRSDALVPHMCATEAISKVWRIAISLINMRPLQEWPVLEAVSHRFFFQCRLPPVERRWQISSARMANMLLRPVFVWHGSYWRHITRHGWEMTCVGFSVTKSIFLKTWLCWQIF